MYGSNPITTKTHLIYCFVVISLNNGVRLPSRLRLYERI